MNIKESFNDAYGLDKYSKFLSIFALILLLSRWSFPFGVAILIYAAWRAFSKNKYKRYREEAAYESFTNSIKYYFRRLINKIKNFPETLKEKRKYVVISCPNCSQKLRLPRHKGKIIVSCKKCNCEFKYKS